MTKIDYDQRCAAYIEARKGAIARIPHAALFISCSVIGTASSFYLYTSPKFGMVGFFLLLGSLVGSLSRVRHRSVFVLCTAVFGLIFLYRWGLSGLGFAVLILTIGVLVGAMAARLLYMCIVCAVEWDLCSKYGVACPSCSAHLVDDRQLVVVGVCPKCGIAIIDGTTHSGIQPTDQDGARPGTVLAGVNERIGHKLVDYAFSLFWPALLIFVLYLIFA